MTFFCALGMTCFCFCVSNLVPGKGQNPLKDVELNLLEEGQDRWHLLMPVFMYIQHFRYLSSYNFQPGWDCDNWLLQVSLFSYHGLAMCKKLSRYPSSSFHRIS